jgi:hypothetical protein
MEIGNDGRRRIGRLAFAVAGAMIAGLVLASTTRVLGDKEARKFREIPRSMLDVIEAGEGAFDRRDAKAVIPYLHDDYSWYIVDGKGAQLAVKGKESTEKLLQQFFTQGQWYDSKVYRMGMVGNILVQVEIDDVGTPQGRTTKTTLNLYEFKDGKRWREWKFVPIEEK